MKNNMMMLGVIGAIFICAQGFTQQCMHDVAVTYGSTTLDGSGNVIHWGINEAGGVAVSDNGDIYFNGKVDRAVASAPNNRQTGRLELDPLDPTKLMVVEWCNTIHTEIGSGDFALFQGNLYITSNHETIARLDPIAMQGFENNDPSRSCGTIYYTRNDCQAADPGMGAICDIAFTPSHVYVSDGKRLFSRFPLNLSTCADQNGEDAIPVKDPAVDPSPEGIAVEQDSSLVYLAINSSLYDMGGLQECTTAQCTQCGGFVYAEDVAVQGRFAYVTKRKDSAADWLYTINLDDQTVSGPTMMNDIGGAENIQIKGCVAFVADNSSTPNLRAYDISDPYQVPLRSICDAFSPGAGTYGGINRMDIGGDYAFLSIGDRIMKVDISQVHALVDLSAPTDEAIDRDCVLTLDWADKRADLLDHYELYFGTTNPPPLVEDNLITSYYPISGLTSDTTYYWKVVAYMTHCGTAESEVWSFKTKVAPGAFNLVSPTNGAGGLDPAPSVTLDWEDSPGAGTYDLYFGASYPPPVYDSITTKPPASPQSQYNLSGLQYNMIYFWKVVAKNSCDSVTTPTWYFITADDNGTPGGGNRIGPNWEYLVSIREGTTAGGTEIVIFSDPYTSPAGATFTTSTKVWFDPDNCNTTTRSCGSYCTTSDTGDADETDSETVELINPRTLKITTRRFFESAYGDSIILDLSGNGVDCSADDILLSNYADSYPAYQFKTLAFTANQHSVDLSVIDTLENKSFTSAPPMDMTGALFLVGLALNKEILYSPVAAGRRLLAADYGSGDMQVYDASNFKHQGTVVLQRKNSPYYSYGAVDVAVDSKGFAYVAHMTSGLKSPNIPPPAPPGWQSPPGGISVVDLQSMSLVDAEFPSNPGTTSPGAPDGMNRIDSSLFPYSIAVLDLTRDPSAYQVGDGYPGEYAFISGVGPIPPEPLVNECTCVWRRPNNPPSTYPCMNWPRGPSPLPVWPYWCISPPGTSFTPQFNIVWDDRPVRIGIIDLNAQKVQAVGPPLQLEGNPNYWKYLGGIDPGNDGQILGISNQGLDFSVVPNGTDATVYAVSPHEDKVYYFNFSDAIQNPSSFPYNSIALSCTDAFGNPQECNPSDVKVQFVDPYTYAYVTNAGNDSVKVIDTADPGILFPYIRQDNLCTDRNHYPTSMDTRSDGSYGYSSDFHAGKVSIFSLADRSMPQFPANCEIGVGEAPIRIVVQPVVTQGDTFKSVKNQLQFARPQDFTTPSKQDNLVRDWERVNQLEQTSANPQAVVSNINNFQKNVDKWVTNTNLKKIINEGVTLYRAAYIHDHPGK